MWAFFIDRVRENLHVVLAMSPIGDGFRNRTRMYPALVSCTTIDWFHEWPKDALQEVALRFLSDVKLEGVDDEAGLRERIATWFAMAHKSVIASSGRMLLELKRHNYVTPTNYLELVKGYRALLSEKRAELGDARDKLQNGLAKLDESREQVEEMSIELEKKQEIVEQKTRECESLLVVIVSERRVADEQKAVVEADSERIGKEELVCKEIAADAEADLGKALPALEKAMAEVEKLDKGSISEVKAYSKPPPAVELVLAAVMTLFGLKTDWATAKKKISEANFLTQIKTYDKDNVSTSMQSKVKKYTKNPDFDPAIVRSSSSAAATLCTWVRAIEIYATVFREVEPKRMKLKAAMDELAEKQASLADAKEKLAAVIAKVDELDARHTASVEEKTALAEEAAALQAKLQRAEQLVSGLSGEKERWTASISDYTQQISKLPGDSLIAAAFLSYAGPFDGTYREKLVAGWAKEVVAQEVPSTKGFSFSNFLADPTDVRQWNIDGLPADMFSTENGVIVTRGRRWPLMVDPQGQANKWIKKKEKSHNLTVVDLKTKNFLKRLELAITQGAPYLLQDVEEELDPALEPVLSKSIIKRGNRELIKLGDAELDYSKDFRLYITTKMANPHYTPEVSTKATIVNFAVKEQGLEAQLLGVVVAMEEPKLEEQKKELVLNVAGGKRKLKELENEILRLLATVEGSLLDDENLVNTLQVSKTTSEEVTESLKIAEETEVKIDKAREGYRPVASRASLLYFVLNDLGTVDPMYQFSLDAYMDLFEESIQDSRAATSGLAGVGEPEELLAARIDAINNHHTLSVYNYACRGLFERHKLLLSLQICVKKMQFEGKVPRDEYDFFLKGGIVMDRSEQKSNPCSDWLGPQAWDNVTEMDKLDGFGGLVSAVEQAPTDWKKWYMSDTPESEPLPGDWEGKVTDLQRMAIVRALRPDRVLFAVTRFVTSNLGPKFVEPPPFDLRLVLESSKATKPMIFVLSPGVDPTKEVLALADSLGVKVEYCSLGQGQAPIATRMIETGLEEGNWVFLQNCHLSISWMPALEKIIENYCTEGDPHPDFRLWLSSSPHPKFPISVLQRGIKMTTEPPRGLKANLLRLYNLLSEEQFNRCSQPGKYKKLLFSLVWFHAVLLERRKFKALGWNIPYEFNNSDFAICEDILAIYIDAYPDKTPWDAIRYLLAEANYGGRITDDWDRRLANVYVNQYFCEDALAVPSFPLSDQPEYYIPEDGDLESYKEYIATLPQTDHPAAFGQHPNADIQSAIQDTNDLLATVISLQPRVVTEGGESNESKVLTIAAEMERQAPAPFNLEEAGERIKSRGDPDPLKTVLSQEIDRYNKLLVKIRDSLHDLQKGIQGLVVITPELEQIFSALLVGTVPEAWAFCYPSLKPLGSWMRDLEQRIEQMRTWLEASTPTVFWLSGFTYPTGFLTALLQTTARRNGVAIDTLSWEFPVMKQAVHSLTAPPEEGAYVRGMFLEGARWDEDEGYLTEPLPMQLFATMPVVHFKPVENKKKGGKGMYTCPLYLYPVRTGTRERPSFMIAVEIKAGKYTPEFWVKRGTALLLALAD
jgi:dynein heavy chain